MVNPITSTYSRWSAAWGLIDINRHEEIGKLFDFIDKQGKGGAVSVPVS